MKIGEPGKLGTLRMIRLEVSVARLPHVRLLFVKSTQPFHPYQPLRRGRPRRLPQPFRPFIDITGSEQPNERVSQRRTRMPNQALRHCPPL